VRIALLLLAAALLGLTGCATIKGWFEPAPAPAQAEQPPARAPQPPARVEQPPAPRAEQPEDSAPRAATPPPSPAPRVTPPTAPRPTAPASAPPPAAPPAPVQPPVLSPVLSAADEQRLRADTQQRLDGAEQRLRQIDPSKLASAQQDSLQTVQSFIDKAREALQAKDIQRAFTLADKAYVLADELTKRPR
jgi:hypothetical protein